MYTLTGIGKGIIVVVVVVRLPFRVRRSGLVLSKVFIFDFGEFDHGGCGN